MYVFTLVLGLAAIAAPYLLNFTNNAPAFWTSLLIGAVLAGASIFEAFADDKDAREYWVIGIAGVAAMLAPFVLGFAYLTTALWTLVIIGVITLVTAGAKLFQSGSRAGVDY